MPSFRTQRTMDAVRFVAAWADQMPELQRQALNHYQPLPNLPTVYLLLRGDEVVYVGQTQDLRTRMRQHNMSAKTQLLEPDGIAWFAPGISSSHMRLLVEAILVCCLCPVGNSALLLRICANRTLAEIRYARKSRH